MLQFLQSTRQPYTLSNVFWTAITLNCSIPTVTPILFISTLNFALTLFLFFILSLDDTDIDALALAKKIRQLAPPVPLILTTTRQRLLPDLLTLDIFACIPQPIQKTQFFSTVKRLLFSLKTTPSLFHFSEYQKKNSAPL
ncbi:response regulator of the lytr/algr family protein [Brochothrix thermosphacta DSM 20171 = FSL F6-1036]|nr:response regulator of the lytr/algr family protein [Brochothrix thermosphacta DSM 20171 = FSL F6-1036]